MAALRGLRADPPDAIVIDLDRLPSQGGSVALVLRGQRATRRVPIVFVGGRPEKVARVRALLPDAAYTTWGRIGTALRRALREPPAEPVAPGVFAGYSGTPLPRKLGIREGARVALLGAPQGLEASLGALSPGATVRARMTGGADVVLLFARSAADLARRFPAAARGLAGGGRLWIAWPKQASGVPTDLREQSVRELGLARGFVDYKICAVDATWSGLCFARRVATAASGRRAS